MGPPKKFWNYLALPFLLTFYPESFDRGHWLGPFYLAALPLALYAAWKRPAERPKLLFAWSFLTVWFIFFHNARFLFQMIPVYAAAAAGGGVSLVPSFVRPLRELLKGIYGGLALALAVLALYHYRLPLEVFCGTLPVEAYVKRVERSLPAAQWANQNLPARAKIFNAEEIRMFYFDRQSLRETWFYLGTRYSEHDTEAPVFAARLRAEGFTHLLVTSEPLKAAGDLQLERRYALIRSLIARSDLVRPLAHIPSRNTRELPEAYDFYELTAV